MDKEIEQKLIKSGHTAAQALKYAESLVRQGVRLVDVCDKTEEKIIALGAMPAFPVQISLNDCAAHYCPEENEMTAFSDQVISIDVGVHIDGYIGGDTALTIDLSKKNLELVKASREALDNALKIVKPGISLGEIGKVIHDTITSHGFSPVRNLSGHGLDKFNIHTKPTVPNYDNNDTTKLEEDMVIAIEPFASTGAGIIYESSPATIFQLINKKPVRNIMTRQVLKEIESYQGLPFCRRWLVRKFGLAKANFALKELKTIESIMEYPPLLDQKHGLVSQAEHTVLVREKPIILTKLE